MHVFDVRSTFQGTFTRRRSVTRFIVVHHAAALYRTPTGLQDVQAIADYHVKTRGWPGIGYHIVLAEEVNGGPIARYEVSDWHLQRAHIMNRNHETLGICCATRFDGVPETKWIHALAETMIDVHRVFPNAQVVGHRDIALPGYGTTCPGAAWSTWRDTLIEALNQNAVRRYRVTAPAGARARQRPTLTAPVVFVLPVERVFSGSEVDGDSVTLSGFGTSRRWVKVANAEAYLWRPLLHEIVP
jgi:hypothetical protein